MSEARPTYGTPPPTRNWLVWSYEHGAWWRDHSRGYSIEITGAGLYTEADAKAIERGANWFPPPGSSRSPEINEQAVPLTGSVSPIMTGNEEIDRRTQLMLETAIRQRDALLAVVNRIKGLVHQPEGELHGNKAGN